MNVGAALGPRASLAASTRSSSAAGAVCTASAWFVGERADVVAQVQLGVAALLKALLECLADEGGRGGAGEGFGAGVHLGGQRAVGG